MIEESLEVPQRADEISMPGIVAFSPPWDPYRLWMIDKFQASPINPSKVYIEGPPDDASLQNLVGAMLPWDACRFRLLHKLEECPRNHGEVVVVEDLERNGLRCAAKRMPISWVSEDTLKFKETYPDEWENPWMDMGLVKWLDDKDFPYSMEYIGAYRSPGDVFFVMGLAEGGDLFTRLPLLHPGDGLAAEQLLRPLVLEVFAAVRALHELGISHCDLSLENVLLTKQGGVKLIDFAASTSQPYHEKARVRGKPTYAAPELYFDRGHDSFAADAFSCGVMLFSMISKNFPWTSTRPGACQVFEYVRTKGFVAYLNKRKINVGPERKIKALEAFSPSLTTLLEGLLSLDPESRLLLKETQDSFGRWRPTVWDHPWCSASN